MPEFLPMTVNGRAVEVPYTGEETLLDLLRDRLDLTGAKEACSRGTCGTCTVVLNGKAVTACTVRKRERMTGAEVLTIEGLAEDGALHPIQEAFVEAGAIQCGFCTPGIVMRLYALFAGGGDPDDAALEKALSRHLCRCTGYETIWKAALLAREKMRARV